MGVPIAVPVGGLSDVPLDAAAEFHAAHLPRIRHEAMAQSPAALALIFEPAGHEHRSWRLAVVQELARELSPTRVNAIAGSDEAAIRQALAYLEGADGVTGQLLSVGNG
jgi:hypothetical protein